MAPSACFSKEMAENALYVGYSTPNKSQKYVAKRNPRWPILLSSDETLDHLEIYQQLGKKFAWSLFDLYLQVKMYRK